MIDQIKYVTDGMEKWNRYSKLKVGEELTAVKLFNSSYFICPLYPMWSEK